MMANSGLAEAILRKHMSQPWAASSSGWMCVSVKKTNSNEPGAGCLAAGNGGSAIAAPAAAKVLRNFLGPRIIGDSSLQNFAPGEDVSTAVALSAFGGVC